MSSQITFVEIGLDELVSTAILSTAESSKVVVINWWKYVLFVLVNFLGGIRMPGNSVCRLNDRVRHDRNSVYWAVKRQSNKIHTH